MYGLLFLHSVFKYSVIGLTSQLRYGLEFLELNGCLPCTNVFRFFDINPHLEQNRYGLVEQRKSASATRIYSMSRFYIHHRIVVWGTG